MATRKPRRPTTLGGGKPPVGGPPRFKTINGVKKRFTGKGRLGVGLGLKGKGKRITNKGYTGKGAHGYGQGRHGIPQHPTAHPSAPGAQTPGRKMKRAIRRLG